MGYLQNLASDSGIAVWLLIIILIWTGIWKLLGMWKAAKNNHVIWFVVIAVLNTVGIVPILYIYVFSKMNKKQKKVTTKKTSKKKSVKKVSRKKKR